MPVTQSPDISVQATHILHNIAILADIIQILSIMIGLGLFLAGILLFKRYSETRTHMSTQISVWEPMAMLLAGVMLLMLPVTVTSSLRAFFGVDQTLPLAYHSVSHHNYEVYIPVVLAFVRLIGAAAIVRACLLFSKAGGSGGRQGQVGRAMLHLFGGILCLHILGTTHLIEKIFDIY